MNMPYLMMPDGVTKLSFSALYSNDVSALVSQIMDELIAPLRRMNVERIEFVTLKALLLLQPDLNGLTIMSRERILESRNTFMRALFGYLCSRTNPADANLRQGSLFMLIPTLTSISRAIAENSILCPLFGLNDGNIFGTSTIASPPTNHPSPQFSSGLQSSAVQSSTEQLLKIIGNCKEGGGGGDILNREMLLAAQLLAQHQSLNSAATTVASSSPPFNVEGLSSAFPSVRLSILNGD